MKVLNFKRLIIALIAVTLLALVVACGQDTPQGNTIEERTFNSLSKNDQNIVKEATASEVLYTYFQFINDGDVDLAIAITNPGTLEGVETIEEAREKYFRGYTVEVLHMEAVNDDIRQTDANNAHYLMLVNIETEEATAWELGVGEQVLYAHLRQTPKGWRIHSFDLAQ